MAPSGAPRIHVPPTVEHDPSLPFTEIDGYRFHTRTFGDATAPVVIVVHGGPGGDLRYLLPMQALARHFFVVFYDQRGTGLSPRVGKEQLTLEQSLQDLQAIIGYFGKGRPVRLLGHSWGAMLVLACLGREPDAVSHAVAVEPGMLTPATAREFVERLKASQTVRDALPMLAYVLQSLLVRQRDGRERFDYVMTRMMNRNKPGGPYQCEGQAMPPDAFARAGFDAFKAMLKPVFDRPERFQVDLTAGLERYRGRLLMLSSACSFIGFHYQQQFHLPLLPPQTEHIEARGMGHNLLTMNGSWSADAIARFLSDGPDSRPEAAGVPAR